MATTTKTRQKAKSKKKEEMSLNETLKQADELLREALEDVETMRDEDREKIREMDDVSDALGSISQIMSKMENGVSEEQAETIREEVKKTQTKDREHIKEEVKAEVKEEVKEDLKADAKRGAKSVKDKATHYSKKTGRFAWTVIKEPIPMDRKQAVIAGVWYVLGFASGQVVEFDPRQSSDAIVRVAS